MKSYGDDSADRRKTMELISHPTNLAGKEMSRQCSCKSIEGEKCVLPVGHDGWHREIDMSYGWMWHKNCSYYWTAEEEKC